MESACRYSDKYRLQAQAILSEQSLYWQSLRMSTASWLCARRPLIDSNYPHASVYIYIYLYIYIYTVYVHIYIYIHVYLSSTSPCLILLTVCIYRCPFAQMWNAMVNIRKKYLVVFVRVDQAHFGEPVSRRRIYILCVRRPSVSASQRLPFDLFAMISSWIKLPLFAQGTSPCES